MLSLSFPERVKLIIGFIYANESYYVKAKKYLINKYGPLDFESTKIDFNFTNYYEQEMGKPLTRRFVSFKNLIDPSKIVEIKLFCLKLEKKLSRKKKRLVNIDPGYLNNAKFILSTTKDFSHRIYLGKGIFAEVTLYYQNKEFRNLPWTYPDFRTNKYKNILASIRNTYRNQL